MLENQYIDRAARALFVALAVGLAWGIRGRFGGPLGAMYPGAMLGLAFAYVSGQESIARRMPVLALLSGILIGVGGEMAYGVLHGYAKSDTFVNYSYGYFMLLLNGGCWGIFGCGALGIALDDRRPTWWEGLLAAFAIIFCGLAFEQFVSHVLEFQVDPRGNSVIRFSGAAIVFVAWLSIRKFAYGLRGAFFGFVGFGTGMFFGRFLSNASEHLPVTINNWNIMEIGCGFIGGLVFTWGMVGLPNRAEDAAEGVSPGVLLAMVYTCVLIPFIHLIALVKPSKHNWAADLAGYGYSDPERLVNQVHIVLFLLALMGFAVLAAWYWVQNAARQDFLWLPALSFSLLMLLFQNFSTLYFFTTHTPGSFNMTTAQWGLFILMIAYVSLRPTHNSLDIDTEARWHPTALRWSAALLVLFMASITLSSVVNGEKTMRSAETRWPPWSWRDGPPQR